MYSTLVRDSCHTLPLVNVYHSKAPDDVNMSIRKDMQAETGNISMIVNTDSAEIGINFRDLQNNPPPQHEIDTSFIKPLRRVGRDGEPSPELILYKIHKRRIRNLNHEMMKLEIFGSGYRRMIIAKC